MTRSTTIALSIVAAAFFLSAPCTAATISIDENGNGIGTVGRGFIAPDPGPGGRPAVLTYQLSFGVTVGDVLLSAAEGIFDVIRFNPNGTIAFYSDNVPMADSLADTTGPPGALYTNVITLLEVGSENENGAVYTPTLNQPGYGPSGPTYVFLSDVTIPEPASITLLLSACCVACVFLAVRRKQTVN